ncbi:M48 family metallopeptidase [Archangium primigenium]|uniref:M48 family metallopeptidase n=1 Tax=[Archangium] primigenium TaxID=2792470 RepID=UPI00195B611F|nr:M48 family metallopeptidase [Archangium primigenium]MBM7113535.1 M48 family metalloprotease [Archangium primigenium]
MGARSSSTIQAMTAVGFLLLFYAGALGVAGLLLALPYLLYTTHRFHALLTVLCLAGSGALVWSLWPRFERFVPPGLRLTEAEHPRLFAAIRDVAGRMGTRMPDAVYLVEDVNAYVLQVGGVLGLGGQRVLCVGLGLLAVDDLSQWRAAVAHEFGHFQGGDTRLVGLLCATRSAMIRTLGGWRFFSWVPETFLRLTQALSRRQELVADTWSVRLAGKRAHLSGLRWEALHARAWRRYLAREVLPLASRGVVPDNLFEGYRRYLASADWAEGLREWDAACEPASCPYDSHPSLEERIAFAERLEAPDVPPDERPAYTLLSDAEALERRFTARLWPRAVEFIPWSAAGEHWRALWNETASRVQARVPDFSLARVAALVKDAGAWEPFAEAIQPRLVGYRAPDRAERVREVVAGSVSAYLASILSAQGLAWRTSPGEPLRLDCAGEPVEPVALVDGLLAGTLGADTLERLRERLAVDADAAWRVPESARAEALEPRAPVTVERTGGAVVVRAPFSRLGLPECCALCGGERARHVETRFHVGGMLRDDGDVTLPVPVCQAHAHQPHKAFKVRHYEEESDLITLEVPTWEYARLIQRSNA